MAAPFTDLTRKVVPNMVKWEEAQELAFHTLKSHLQSEPVLSLPDDHKTFILAADISDLEFCLYMMES